MPNKMLLYLHGYPIIEWVYKRVKKSKKIDQIIFALPETKQNDVLANYLQSVGAKIFRGSELDLVDRYYKAAISVSADEIVRVCADNPLICASEIDNLINYFHQNQCDYAYNQKPIGNNYPDGLGAEICKTNLVEEIFEKSTDPNHREHLFNYIWGNQHKYNIRTFNPVKDIAFPSLRLDLDTIDDYQKLLNKPYKIEMSAKEIIELARGA